MRYWAFTKKSKKNVSNRVFNTTGICDPAVHYMVDLTQRLFEVRKLVDEGKYFTINRARQFGKTTTLHALAEYLSQDYPGLGTMLRDILFCGKGIPFNLGIELMSIGAMFGFLKDEDGQFVTESGLDVEKILKKFVEHFTESFGNSTDAFVEENGRKLFLLYICPLINGIGNYYIEARTRSMGRTDLIIDYLGKQYIISKEDICSALTSTKIKKPGVQEIHFKNHTLVEAVV